MAGKWKYHAAIEVRLREPALWTRRGQRRTLSPALARLARPLLVPLVAVTVQACENAPELPLEQIAGEDGTAPLVFVRRGSTGTDGSAALSVESGGSYFCEDPSDCWNQCPEPIEAGGTTVCSCLRTGGGNFACSVTFYGPDDEIPGLGAGGGGSGCGSGGAGGGGTQSDCVREWTCGDARDGLASELKTHTRYNGPQRSCDEFFRNAKFIKQDSDTESGKHEGYGYVHDAMYAGFAELEAAWGRKLHVTSGYRCPNGDVAAGGSGNGYHTRGRAADLYDYEIRVVQNRYPTKKEFDELRFLAELLALRTRRATTNTPITIYTYRGETDDDYGDKAHHPDPGLGVLGGGVARDAGGTASPDA